MKKIKFLNGISVFALAAVALATTLTSCEKEEFNVKFDPSPAKVVFSPNVIDAASGTNVTDKATFVGNEAVVSTASDKKLAAGEATISATVNGVTGSVVVKYPAVDAGQVVSISPIIILSAEFDFEAIESSVENVGAPVIKYGSPETGAITHDGKQFVENATEYMVNFKATWNETAQATKATRGISAPNAWEVENIGEEGLKASAWCMYTAKYTIQPANVEYKLTSKVTGDVITEVYYNPIYSMTASTYEIAHPSHSHAYTHGHGHGDNPNAGGGITLAD